MLGLKLNHFSMRGLWNTFCRMEVNLCRFIFHWVLFPLVQIWLAPSHYLGRRWRSSLTHICVTKPQWVQCIKMVLVSMALCSLKVPGSNISAVNSYNETSSARLYSHIKSAPQILYYGTHFYGDRWWIDQVLVFKVLNDFMMSSRPLE